MKHYIIVAFLLPVTLVLLQGCKRKAPGDAAEVQGDVSSETEAESGVEMVQLPGGRFTMGDENEIDAPLHEVVISSFYMDKYLVTQEEYRRVIGKNPSRWKAEKNPVEQVRWSDAVRYCNARSLLEGLQPCYDLNTWRCNFDADGYRLPTEAEWEYACRAGTKTKYFFGDDASKLKAYAWYEDNSGGKPPSGRSKVGESVGTVRYARQRLGMVQRLLQS